MQSQVSEISPVLVEVRVEVPWERVKQDLDRSFSRIGRTAKIRGFRPGKIPGKVVRQLFGKQVRGEVSAQLVEEGLMAAVQEHELQIVAEPEVEAPSITDGEPLAFTAKCEVRPQVGNLDLAKLVVHRPAEEVEGSEVDAEVERLRQQHAELREPDPMRPAREGDELLIDYTVTLDGEPREDLGAKDRKVDIGGGHLLPDFEKGLLGAVPGESRTIELTFEEDHDKDDLRGKKAVFEVQVRELKEKLLPEVDDEFAKDCGEYETLLELRLDLRKRLEQMATQRAEAELKDRLVDKLVETHEVPVPPAMVRAQKQQMITELASFLQMTGNRELGEGIGESFIKTLDERAERRVKAAILLGALARQEGVQVGEEDLSGKLAEIAERTGKHPAKIRVEYQDRLDQIESQILEEKLMALLRTRATIVDGPPPEEEETPEAEAPEAKAEEAEASAPAKKKKKKAADKKTPEKTTAAAKKKTAKKKTPKKKKADSDKDASTDD